MILATAVVKADECRKCSDHDASPCWLPLVVHPEREMVN